MLKIGGSAQAPKHNMFQPLVDFVGEPFTPDCGKEEANEYIKRNLIKIKEYLKSVDLYHLTVNEEKVKAVLGE